MLTHAVRLTFEGRDPQEIQCREDEDVVTAALRQRLLLLSDCRQGTCGSCRARLHEGRYEALLEHSPHALSEREEEEGWILACRLQPRSPLHLDFDYPGDRVARIEGRTAGRIVALERVTPSVARVVVRTSEAQEPLWWHPGQHVRVRLAGVSRLYSIANLPGPARELELYVALLPGGRLSGALEVMPGPGAAVVVEGPHGAFRLGPAGSEPVFVAGGTGLAPILAMLRALAPGGRRATLVFGARRPGDLFALPALAALQAGWPALTLHLCVVEAPAGWTGERGTAVEVLKRLLAAAPPGERAYHLCGPAGMVDAARAVLEARRIPPRDIHREPFVTTKEACP